MVKLWKLIVASSLVSVLALVSGYGALNGDVPAIVLCNLGLGAFWCALLIAAIFWYRWRALWLLISAPFLLYWPVGLWFLARACRQYVNACP